MSQLDSNLGMTNYSNSMNNVVRGSNQINTNTNTNTNTNNVPQIGSDLTSQPNVTTDLFSFPPGSAGDKLGADIRKSVKNDLDIAYAEASPLAIKPGSTGLLDIGSGGQLNVQGSGLPIGVSNEGKGDQETVTVTRKEFESLVAELTQTIKKQAEAEAAAKYGKDVRPAPSTGAPLSASEGGSPAPPLMKPIGIAPAPTSSPSEVKGETGKEASANPSKTNANSDGVSLYKKAERDFAPDGFNEFEKAALKAIKEKFGLTESQLSGDAGGSKLSLDQLLKKMVDTAFADGVITDIESNGIKALTDKGGGKNLSDDVKMAMLTKILDGTKNNFDQADLGAFDGVLNLMASDTKSTPSASGDGLGLGLGGGRGLASPPTGMSSYEFNMSQLSSLMQPRGQSSDEGSEKFDAMKVAKKANDANKVEPDEDEEEEIMKNSPTKSEKTKTA